MKEIIIWFFSLPDWVLITIWVLVLGSVSIFGRVQSEKDYKSNQNQSK
ncbi:MAG: hypothetical protein ACI4TD_00675 [Phocaeicola sp.]